MWSRSRGPSPQLQRDPSTGPTLFITRKFPPAVGGMETLASNVWEALRTVEPDALLIAHGGSVARTPLWLPGAAVRLAVLTVRRRVGAVLCGDVLLYGLVGPILRLTGVPHAVMAMGLDVTYDNALYRRTILPGLRRAPRVLAISSATADAVRGAGVDPDRIEVIAMGLPDPGVDRADAEAARSRLHAELGLDPEVPIVVTVGRLVPRKGVAWFVSEVVPQLHGDVHYVVAGDGPDAEAIESAVQRLGLASRVHLLGRVSDERRSLLMSGADLFVQPNVPVAGDMEGFGLVAIEAAMHGTVVLASELEGLRDAVEDSVTGRLIPAEDAARWASEVTGLLEDRAALADTAERFRDACVERSSLGVMQEQLVVAMGIETG